MEELAVLVVDRDDATRENTVGLIEDKFPDATVSACSSQTEATEAMRRTAFDVLVTGYVLPDGNGLELAEAARELSPSTTCLLYTQAEAIETESFEELVVDFVGKETPGAEETLLGLIDHERETITQAAHLLPEDEERRQESVNRYQPTEQARNSFRRIASLAQRHFDGDAAVVALIDRHKQQVVASVGEVVTPSNRDESLGTHVLAQEGGTMAVGDVRVDPRFAAVETIQSAGIVSYLGAVIEDADGHGIGVLSVYDDNPREFTAEDHRYIRTLADLAADVGQFSAGGGRA